MMADITLTDVGHIIAKKHGNDLARWSLAESPELPEVNARLEAIVETMRLQLIEAKVDATVAEKVSEKIGAAICDEMIRLYAVWDVPAGHA